MGTGGDDQRIQAMMGGRASGMGGPLRGRTIALPESRELDRLASLLEAEGAAVRRCPLVAILDTPDQAAVGAWLRALVASPADDLIFLTGEGVRRLVAAAGRLAITDAVVGAFRRARRITRGPKPARALRELGLSPDLPADPPTSAGVILSLAAADLAGRRVGVQLYGQEPNVPLVSFLEGRGATVTTVAPYVYAPASDAEAVASLLDDMAAGAIDAIGFTSAGQVDRLWAVAKERGAEERLAAALARTKVAAVGPVVAEALTERGARVDVPTTKPFVMKHFVAAIAAHFQGAGA